MSSSPEASAARRHAVVEAREAFFGYYPGSVAVISSGRGDERNVMSAGWHTALSAAPPLYGVAVAPERHSHALIEASARFGVNFLPFELAEAIAGAGLLCGADVGDKLARLGLDWYADRTGLPLLSGAFLAYSCRLHGRVPTGDHDLFVGEVERVHYDPDAFDGRVKAPGRRPATIYYGRSIYEGIGDGPFKRVPPETFRGPGEGGGDR